VTQQLSKADQIRQHPHLRCCEVAELLGVGADYVSEVRRLDSNPDFRRRRSAAVTRSRRKRRDYYNAYGRAWYSKKNAEARAS
jgi:hypothetical protein